MILGSTDKWEKKDEHWLQGDEASLTATDIC
jgi:hypothetical protein